MHPSSMTPRDLEHILCDETAEPMPLPLSLLREITDGFSDELRIGSGGFAVVYKGKLQNRTVAVKRMSDVCMDETLFHREVQCLMLTKHTNIVRFLGYCADRQGIMDKYQGKFVMADIHQRLLCFEYLPKGSLHEYITDTSGEPQWRDRFGIIMGICHGLHYLHQKNIVHVDLKPANILLDNNLVAKIADFGLSRCFGETQSRIITMNIRGTLGYLPPEFGNGEITYQLDIFSLGVIIMEIITGKKGYHDVDKVVESWSNMVEKTQRDIQLKQVRVCSEIGIKCINSNPAERPNTKHIITRLGKTEIMYEAIKTSTVTSPQCEDTIDVVRNGDPQRDETVKLVVRHLQKAAKETYDLFQLFDDKEALITHCDTVVTSWQAKSFRERVVGLFNPLTASIILESAWYRRKPAAAPLSADPEVVAAGGNSTTYHDGNGPGRDPVSKLS